MQWTRKSIGWIHNPNKMYTYIYINSRPLFHYLFKSIPVTHSFVSDLANFDSNGVVNEKKGIDLIHKTHDAHPGNVIRFIKCLKMAKVTLFTSVPVSQCPSSFFQCLIMHKMDRIKD